MTSVLSTYHTGPVTSLCVVNERVIGGIGNSLYLYDLTEKVCVSKSTSVIYSGNIHGIRKCPYNSLLLCVFGGKAVRVVRMRNKDLEPQGQQYQADDWIWDVSWIQEPGQCDQLVVVTAHNVVLRLDGTMQKLARVRCVENCILYCARFLGQCWDHLIVAAGTVFNQVLLWAPNGQTNSDGQSLVIHRLVGHQGVIFSIDFSADRRQICTVSDDRSVRVWQLQFPGEAHQGVISLAQWQQCQNTELFVLYGHSARVWDARLLTNTIVSVGEDSTCCVWDHQGKITQRFQGHKGKSIWSLAVEDTGKFAVTGGGDSSIRVWYMDEMQTSDHLLTQVLGLPSPQENGEDFPRIVTMVTWDIVVIMTNEGRLLLHDLGTGGWRTLMSDVTFTSYCVMSPSPYHTHIIAVGNISGTMRLLYTPLSGNSSDNALSKFDMEWHQKDFRVHDGKVFSIYWTSATNLLTNGPDGQMIYWNMTFSDDQTTLQKLCTLELPPCKHRWVSAAAVPDNLTPPLLICGDRGGSVHVYPLVYTKQTKSPIQTFYRIHGKTCVSHVCCHGNHVYTAGRDGTYNQYDVDQDKLVLLHTNRIHKGFDWLDRLDFTRKDGDILVYGFQSNNFVLWSVQNNQRLVQIPCGGGHRAWDSRIYGNRIRYVYIRTGEVVLSETELSTNQVLLKESLHGRELSDVLHIKTYNQARPVHVIASCSEDTQIQILTLAYNVCDVMELKSIAPLQAHISSVRTMALCDSGLPWKRADSEMMLLFSGGGRAQILVWRVTIPKSSGHHGDVDLRGLSHETLCNYMMDSWNNKNRKPWKGHDLKPNPETRFMDLAAVRARDVWSSAPPGVHIVMAACSDGYVRFYCFDEDARTLTLMGESLFHDHCVLQVQFVIHTTPNGGGHLVCLSAATDGQIAFWDLNRLVLGFLSEHYRQKLSVDLTNRKEAHSSKIVESVDSTLSESEAIETTSGFSMEMCHQNCPVNNEPSTPSNDLQSHSKSSSTSEGELCDTIRGELNISGCYGNGSHGNHAKSKMDADKSTDILDPVFAIPSHQSGINSLHIYKVTECTYMVASGGDDNAIRLSRVTMATDPSQGHLEVTVSDTVLEESAHSAQITGIHVLGERRVLSASVDQRVCLWDMSRSPEGVTKLRQMWCKCVQVSDISSLAVWGRESLNILAAGVGMEMLSAH